MGSMMHISFILMHAFSNWVASACVFGILCACVFGILGGGLRIIT